MVSIASSSLSSRFLLASLLLLPLFLGISGYMLEKSFQRSQQAARQEQLKSYVYLLMGAAEFEDGKLWMPEQLTEPRFNNLNSGLMATIGSHDGILWQSASTLFEPPADTVPLNAGYQQFHTIDINGKAQSARRWLAYSHDVSWQQSSGDDQLLRFTVLHNQAPLQAELQSFRNQLWQWLGALALFLLATQWSIMRWGLNPLRQVASDLQQIEQGSIRQLKNPYPQEITPVIDNLNRVLSSEQQQRDRYRNTMSDLAHSLKTPLSVMRSQLAGSTDDAGARQLDEQLTRMDQIIRHQLKRAIRSNSTSDHSLPLAPLVNRLTHALGKVYATSKVDFEVRIAEDTCFQGDEADLLEILGNLLENACKYGNGKVLIEAGNSGQRLNLSVGDNGAGVAPEQQALILQRGARADTAQPGQGIGLAVVIDIVSSYNGELRIEQSELGGARFRLSLG